MDEKMRLENLSKERITEIEKLSLQNGKLLLKISMLMCELERTYIMKFGDTGLVDDTPQTANLMGRIGRRNWNQGNETSSSTLVQKSSTFSETKIESSEKEVQDHWDIHGISQSHENSHDHGNHGHDGDHAQRKIHAPLEDES